MTWPPPALPGETSRSTFTTPGGTDVTDIRLTLNGDACRVQVPENYEADVEGIGPLTLVALHGHNSSEAIIDGVNSKGRYDYYRDRGGVWVSSNAKGNAWGSTAGQNAYANIVQLVTENVQETEHVVLHGGSMGGLMAALIYANDLIPNVRCAVIVDGALSLNYSAILKPESPYRAAIRSAYGIASDFSDYATKTAGHDPCLLGVGAYDGKRLFLSASYGDSAIEQTHNTDLFMARFNGRPDALSLLQQTGPHVDASHYPVSEFATFVNAALGTVGPPPVPAAQFPPGISKIGRVRMRYDGVYVDITA